MGYSPVTVVLELVVTCESDETAERHTQRIEDLICRILPWLNIGKHVEQKKCISLWLWYIGHDNECHVGMEYLE